ncbi:cyclic pyranopterin monophosphate synthase MoaC [Halomonas sp. WWR20]
MSLSHLNARGEAHMVDVADKPETRREAVARGRIHMLPETLALLAEGGLPKGDVLATARIAGIQAAKRTHELIPLCHALMLSKVSIDFQLDEQQTCVDVEARCRLTGRTGVEMEALTAVSVACLTLYDMCKAVDKGMRISDIRLESKLGGKSGDWQREAGDRDVVVDAPLPEGESEIPLVRVKFLAELRERVHLPEVDIPLEAIAGNDVAGLKSALAVRDKVFSILDESRVLCAVNQVMATDASLLTDGDEVAFFPPVTGG